MVFGGFLPEVVQADECGAVVGPPLVVCRRLQVLEQHRLEQVGAGEVGRNDGEQPPALYKL